MKRLLFIAFCFEIGSVLIIVPWMAFWDRNYFAQLLPPLYEIMTNNFVRGAVSGLGLINVLVGLTELVALITRRTSERPASISPSQFANENE